MLTLFISGLRLILHFFKPFTTQIFFFVLMQHPQFCIFFPTIDLLLVSLVFLALQYRSSPQGSSEKIEAQKQWLDVMSHRIHVDHSIELIAKLIFGSEKGLKVINSVRSTGKPLVDDWACLKSMVCLSMILLLNCFLKH